VNGPDDAIELVKAGNEIAVRGEDLFDVDFRGGFALGSTVYTRFHFEERVEKFDHGLFSNKGYFARDNVLFFGRVPRQDVALPNFVLLQLGQGDGTRIDDGREMIAIRVRQLLGNEFSHKYFAIETLVRVLDFAQKVASALRVNVVRFAIDFRVKGAAVGALA
jgi:hypothetical protein